MQIRLFGQRSLGILNHRSQFGIYHMTFFSLSDWLEDQISALRDLVVYKKAK